MSKEQPTTREFRMMRKGVRCGVCGTIKFRRPICDECMKRATQEQRNLLMDGSLEDFSEVVMELHTARRAGEIGIRLVRPEGTAL